MKVHEIVGIKPVENVDVGIEIEVEGNDLPYEMEGVWKIEPDGSLRGGLEYVYRVPQPLSKVEESLDFLNYKFEENNAKPSFSFRTSVHVHVNCLDLEYNHLLNYIYTYYLLERILVDFCGDSRKGNRFCLRLEDADGSLEYIQKLFASRGSPRTMRDIPRDMVRYAALNVESLSKFGTLEFRSMRGTIDKGVILPWAETLVHIREYSSGFDNAKSIYDRLEEIGERQFFEEAIGKHHLLFDNGQVEASINMGRSLSIDIPFIEQAEAIVGDAKKLDPDKRYRINGAYIAGYKLIDYFGYDFPENIWEQIREQEENERKEIDMIFEELEDGEDDIDDDDYDEGDYE